MDVPQQWDSNGSDADFKDLTNWPASTTARCIRPFRDFLVALDVTASGTRNPYRVMWSDATDPWTEPSSWVAASTNLAGDVYLSEGDDYVMDCLPLRGINIVYKEDSTYAMRYVGGNTVFTFDKIFSEHGILAPRCVVAFEDSKHFVVTRGDIVVHDGNLAQSIADNSVRHTIFSEIDPTYYPMCYVVSYYKEEEIWFCYATSSTAIVKANKAAIWNYRTGAWTFRDLPSSTHIASGTIDTSTGQDWDSDSGQWNADTTSWNQGVYGPAADELLMIERGSTVALDTTANAKFHQVDSSNQFDGTNMVSYVRRTGVDLNNDPSSTVFIRKAFPVINGGPVKIRVGGAMSQNGTYTWSPYQDYDPSSGNYKVDVRVTGRFLGYEIYSDTDVGWKVKGMALDGVLTGYDHK